MYTPRYDKTVKGCPKRDEQLDALTNNAYWTVLNCDLFNSKPVLEDPSLRFAVNSLKHRLQVYGPYNQHVTHDRRPNLGAAQGSIFHHHVKGSTPTTYVIEWAITDVPNKKLAIIGFAKHENYPYHQRPLTKEEVNRIDLKPSNIKILTDVIKLKKDAMNRIRKNESNASRGKMSKKEFRSRMLLTK